MRYYRLTVALEVYDFDGEKRKNQDYVTLYGHEEINVDATRDDVVIPAMIDRLAERVGDPDNLKSLKTGYPLFRSEKAHKGIVVRPRRRSLIERMALKLIK